MVRESKNMTDRDRVKIENRSEKGKSRAPKTETESGLHGFHGLSIVGSQVKRLVEAVTALNKLGVDAVEPLPELVLVGDQSSGKSTLMGALAEFHLPSGSGMTTACPVRIKTSSGPEWSCTVSILQHYKYDPPEDGRIIQEDDITIDRPFVPWTAQRLKTTEFQTFTEPSFLEPVVRWAQIAILNPSRDPLDYRPRTGIAVIQNRTSTELKFSPNVIAVEITRPGASSLCFYDLPGVFQSHEDANSQYLAKVVQNLVIDYIKRPNALVICVMPMKDDPGTSTTAGMIMRLGVQDRCVGVFTQADRYQDGEIAHEWERMLNGTGRQLKYGYFATKQPYEVRGDVSDNFFADARRDEEAYFRTTHPWCGVWNKFSYRFGTVKIQYELSQRFAQQVTNSLPTITQAVEKRIAKINHDLSKLPDLPTQNYMQEVNSDLSRFDKKIENLLLDDTPAFQKDYNVRVEFFYATILKMRPRVNLTHPSDTKTDVIDISDDDEVVIPPQATTPKPSKKGSTSSRGGPPQTPSGRSSSDVTPNKRVKTESGTKIAHHLSAERNTSLSRKTTAKGQASIPNPFEKFLEAGKLFETLQSLSEVIAMHRRPGAPPNYVALKVHDMLSMKSVKPWLEPAQLLLRLTLSPLRTKTQAIFKETLSRWQQTLLYRKALAFFADFFKPFEEHQLQRIEELFKLESHKVFIHNKVAYGEIYQTKLKELKEERLLDRAKAMVQSDKKAFSSDAEISDADLEKEIQKKMKYLTDKGQDQDTFETEIDVIAKLLAYYELAGQRFAGNIMLSLRVNLLKYVEDELRNFLPNKLELTKGEDHCRYLLEENPKIAENRQTLKEELKSLEKAMEELRKLFEATAAGAEEDTLFQHANSDIEMVNVDY